VAIGAEWSSARSYATRVANLRGTGTGERLNGNYSLKGATASTSATVLDDAAVDRLMGGPETDWFFVRLSGTGSDTLDFSPATELRDSV
jgi:hypothetical protein